MPSSFETGSIPMIEFEFA